MIDTDGMVVAGWPWVYFSGKLRVSIERAWD
jgi:hypothetical protein